MKIKLLVLLVTFLVLSCNDEKEIYIEKYNLTEELKSRLDFNFNSYNFQNEKYIAEHDLFVVEILSNSKLSGVLVVDKDMNAKGFGNLKNDNFLEYYDVNLNKNYIFDMEFSSEHNLVLPNFNENENINLYPRNNSCQNSCQGGLILCTATCTLAALAVAASDGPLPFMDVVAAAGWTTCNGTCAYSHQSCMRGCL
jgi:hypothetical protein